MPSTIFVMFFFRTCSYTLIGSSQYEWKLNITPFLQNWNTYYMFRQSTIRPTCTQYFLSYDSLLNCLAFIKPNSPLTYYRMFNANTLSLSGELGLPITSRVYSSMYLSLSLMRLWTLQQNTLNTSYSFHTQAWMSLKSFSALNSYQNYRPATYFFYINYLSPANNCNNLRISKQPTTSENLSSLPSSMASSATEARKT